MAKEGLHSVLKLAEVKEKDAAFLYVDAQKVLDSNQSKLEELCEFRSDYHQKAEARISPSQFQSTRQFLFQLSEVIDIQEQQLEITRISMLREKENWLDRRVERKSIEKLKEKWAKKLEKVRQSREQGELDEFASQAKNPFS
ncbi:MAG: flagellar export protein FliJ [Pseudomonadales bacterium]|nr:flagellar export protein FliJ [Pseudomonadales bacterium]